MRVEYTRTALKALQRCDARLRERIREKIKGLGNEPPEGDIKPLSGRPGFFRLRVGEYRIIYRLEGDIIDVQDIGPRGDIYK